MLDYWNASAGAIFDAKQRCRPGWLPIPPRRFNIMLRVYGPLGAVASGDYIPPPIEVA